MEVNGMGVNYPDYPSVTLEEAHVVAMLLGVSEEMRDYIATGYIPGENEPDHFSGYVFMLLAAIDGILEGYYDKEGNWVEGKRLVELPATVQRFHFNATTDEAIHP